MLAGGIDPGQQLITVIRKGSRAVQQLRPRHAFGGRGFTSSRCTAWFWRSRRSGVVDAARLFRALSYLAARACSGGQPGSGSNWTLHDLRHSASYRWPGTRRCG